jgi:MOSC domain-containing protein YiiM
MATISSIVYKPTGGESPEGQDAYLRVPAEQVRLVEGHGIEGDEKAGHHPDRQLNLLSRDWVDAARLKGYKASPGQFGEQIVIDGLSFQTLPPGMRLQLGSNAVIEIVKPRTGCDRFERAQEGRLRDGNGTLGVMARVISGGVVKVGDEVKMVEQSPAG